MELFILQKTLFAIYEIMSGEKSQILLYMFGGGWSARFSGPGRLKGHSIFRECEHMKTEQAKCHESIAQGRLITLSQWDGSAFKAPEEKGLPASERGEGRYVTEGPETEGMTPAAT
jgi:hypothetical protein